MMEKLSPQDLIDLEEALDDGFQDWSFPRERQETISIGKAFDTSPLFDVKLRIDPNGNYDDIKNSPDEINLSKDEALYQDLSSTLMFISSPFGFDVKKLDTYFGKKHTDFMEQFGVNLKKEHEELLDEAWDWEAEYTNWDPEGWEESIGHWGNEAIHFNDFILSRQHPYTKAWFELIIYFRIKSISSTLSRIRNIITLAHAEQDWPSLNVLIGTINRVISDAGTIGRLVEHYRWKFHYESTVIKKRSHEKNLGKLGGQKSSIAKNNRLNSFMDEIEKLGDLFHRVPEASIIDIAFNNAVKSNPNLWKQGKGQKDEYLEQHIRSEEPYKSRYYAIFGKTA